MFEHFKNVTCRACDIVSVAANQFLPFFSPLVEKGTSTACSSALLAAQPHSWINLRSQLPLLTIKTTSSKAAMLNLPPG